MRIFNWINEKGLFVIHYYDRISTDVSGTQAITELYIWNTIDHGYASVSITSCINTRINHTQAINIF